MRLIRGHRLLSVALAGSLSGVAWAEPDVVETTRGVTAYTRPVANGRFERGLVNRKTRVRVLERAEGKGCRRQWLRIGDRAWICSTATRPTDKSPTNLTQPRLRPGRNLPHAYIVTKGPTPVYPTLEDAAAGTNARTLRGLGGFVHKGATTVGGQRFLKTSEGWISRERARIVTSIAFHGVALTGADRGKRLAFVGHRPAPVYDESGEPLETAPVRRHTYLGPISEPLEAGELTLYPIGKGRHLRQQDLRIVEPATPPREIAEDEFWIDVHKSQQTLVAYRGARPLYATLVSTARRKTPTGVFRVEKMRPHARLRSKPSKRDRWDVITPWVITIRRSIAMHSVYWHSDFGYARSHGCINLSPRDAKWIWDRIDPRVPPGWARVDTRDGTRATIVRIRR